MFLNPISHKCTPVKCKSAVIKKKNTIKKKKLFNLEETHLIYKNIQATPRSHEAIDLVINLNLITSRPFLAGGLLADGCFQCWLGSLPVSRHTF